MYSGNEHGVVAGCMVIEGTTAVIWPVRVLRNNVVIFLSVN
jgi:translation initiation factor IF-2